MGLKRAASEGSARRRDDVGVAEGIMGRKEMVDAANAFEDTARGTTAGRTGGRERRRVSEGGIRGMAASWWFR